MRLDRILKKKFRIRNKLKKSNTNNRLILTVNRSSRNISAQIIDDINNKTIVTASSVEKNIKNIAKTKKIRFIIICRWSTCKKSKYKKYNQGIFW